MTRTVADFTIGVEEEYQLIHPATRDLHRRQDHVLRRAQGTLSEEVQPELYQTQIEMATPVCRTLADGKRQDSERNGAVTRVILRWPLPNVTYPACSTAHTAPHRSTKSRRCSAKDTVSFMRWRQRK